jgi:hypothetical protein
MLSSYKSKSVKGASVRPYSFLLFLADEDCCRKYPQFQQGEIFGLQDTFRKLDVDDKGYLDEATTIKATQHLENQPYDVVRQALKEVDLDSSRRVELEDFVDVNPHPLQLVPHGALRRHNSIVNWTNG